MEWPGGPGSQKAPPRIDIPHCPPSRRRPPLRRGSITSELPLVGPSSPRAVLLVVLALPTPFVVGSSVVVPLSSAHSARLLA